MMDNLRGWGIPILSHGLPDQLPRRVGDDLACLTDQNHPLPRDLPHPFDHGLHAGPAFVLGIVLGQEPLEALVTHHPPVLLVASEHPGGGQGVEEGHAPHRCHDHQDQCHKQAKTQSMEHFTPR